MSWRTRTSGDTPSCENRETSWIIAMHWSILALDIVGPIQIQYKYPFKYKCSSKYNTNTNTLKVIKSSV